MRLAPLGRSRLLASTAFAALLAAGLAGCKTTNGPETTGSIANAERPTTDSEWRSELAKSEALYKAAPDNVAAATQYAQALRATGQRAQAVAVLEQVTIKNPHNKALLGAYGRALADIGNFNQALE